MNETEVTREGLRNVRPGREALSGVHVGDGPAPPPSKARRERRGGEELMVPKAEFRSYYGKPVLNAPVWASPTIPGYLFLGGLAGAGSTVAAAARATRRPRLARTLELGSAVAVGLSLAALVHDLGRPRRFSNMLRTFKVTSPMSVGSWLLCAYGPVTAIAAVSDVTGIAPAVGTLTTAAAAVLGPAVATYTAALVSDTAVPAWHDAFREMPFVFAASAVTSAAGLGLIGAPVSETGPVRMLGVAGGLAELATERVMMRRMGLAAEAFEEGKADKYHRLAEGLLGAGVVGALFARRRAVAALSGASLLAGSALTRFAIFEAGVASTRDPKYTVVPQRRRLQRLRGAPVVARPAVSE